MLSIYMHTYLQLWTYCTSTVHCLPAFCGTSSVNDACLETVPAQPMTSSRPPSSRNCWWHHYVFPIGQRVIVCRSFCSESCACAGSMKHAHVPDDETCRVFTGISLYQKGGKVTPCISENWKLELRYPWPIAVQSRLLHIYLQPYPCTRERQARSVVHPRA